MRKLDLLKVGERYSNNVVNFGFDTTVAITINKEREKTGHGSKDAYTKGVVTALIKSMNNRCTVTADGEVLNPDGRALLCTLANGQYVGGSFCCAPRSKKRRRAYRRLPHPPDIAPALREDTQALHQRRAP